MLKKGFTLIELLIVIVIIGILSVAVIPRVLDYPKKARDSQRKVAISALNTAISAYITDDGTAPTKLTGCVDGVANYLGVKISSYLGGNLPKDPQSTHSIYGSTCDYYYVVDKDAAGKISAYAFAAYVEVPSNGNTASATGAPADVAGVTNTAISGQYYAFKQTL